MDGLITENYKFTQADVGTILVGFHTCHISTSIFFEVVGLTKAGKPRVCMLQTCKETVEETPNHYKYIIKPYADNSFPGSYLLRPSKKHGGWFLCSHNIVVCEKYDPNKVYYDEWYDR